MKICMIKVNKITFVLTCMRLVELYSYWNYIHSNNYILTTITIIGTIFILISCMAISVIIYHPLQASLINL